MNKTILFIGGGVESVPGIRSAKSLGLRVIVSDYSPSAPGFQLSDYSIVSSTYDIEGTWREVEVYLKLEGPIHGVLSVATDVPLTVASIAKRLGTPGISIDAAKLSMDKIAMKVRFRESGIPIPWFSEVFSVDEIRSALDNIPELIIKPVDSRGARGVQRISDKAEIVEAFKNAKENSPSGRVMIEEFLSGHQIKIGRAHV